MEKLVDGHVAVQFFFGRIGKLLVLKLLLLDQVRFCIIAKTNLVLELLFSGSISSSM